jgi:hypothetical protein
MITTRCARPDRVIKVFDYLTSEQGQRDTYYGKEGTTYHFVKRPGETGETEVKKPDGTKETKTVTYKYGLIEWTDHAKALLGASNASGWYNEGIKQISLLTNPMYVMLTSKSRADMDTYQFYVRYNMKAALIPYTYSRIPFRYTVDMSDIKRYNNMIDIQENIESMWIRYLPGILMAGSKAAAEGLTQSAIAEAQAYGSAEWLAYRNEGFTAFKQAQNITYAWPKNDPSYAAPAVKLRGEPALYAKPIPDYISISE